MGARTVAVEHVVHAAFDIYDKRYFDHHEVQFFAKVIFDVALHVKDCLLGFAHIEQRAVVLGKNLFEFLIIADPRTGQVGFLIEHKSRHRCLLAGGVFRRRNKWGRVRPYSRPT
jgi:hypothetical protein